MEAFFVSGTPVGKGSLKAFIPKGWTRPVLTSTGGQPLKDWNAAVAYTAREKGVTAIEGAVCVSVQFILHRPQSLPKKVLHHVKKPDLDKLSRSVLDSLTGVAYRDDSQVVNLDVSKEYTIDGQTGAWIRVGEVM